MRLWAEKAKAHMSLGVVAVGVALVALATSCASTEQRARGGVDVAKVRPVAVYPLAGTPDASPRSEISFRGIRPAKLTGIRVIGSKSGRHLGKLKRHSDGQGASFVPNKRFAPGEIIHVRANVPLIGARHGAVAFRVARPPAQPPGPPNHFPDGSRPLIAGASRYHSRPGLHPPAIKVTTASQAASAGYLFMAPKSWPGQGGPLIFDPRGRIVWFHPVPRGFKSYDFRTATYRGKKVLTWWQGRRAEAHGGGTGMIADSSYRVIATVKGGNGYPVDIHEFRVTPQGTALIISYRAVRQSLRAMGVGNNQSAIDGIVMEIDVKTGRVLFEWHALGHIPLSESYRHPRIGKPVDYVHLNSVALDQDGNFLISARNTSTVYKVDRRTGRIIWRLGGKHSSFKLPKYARFTGQHDFTSAGHGTYMLFDNANLVTPVRWISRGLVFAIDGRAHTARLLRAFAQPQHRGTTTQGSVQLLPDGHYVVGWGGGIPDISEFAPGGKLLFDAHLLAKVQSYRSYRFPWTGQPKRPPDVAAVAKKGRTIAYASWNGATEVETWELLAGDRRNDLSVAAQKARRSFETAIAIPRSAAYVAVRALDSSGNALGTSKTVKPRIR